MVYSGIVVLATMLFLPFLGSVLLFDTDELYTAELAREMIVTGSYLDLQIDFERVSEQAPLFIWMQVLSMKVFGVTEFAARFPNFLCAVFSMMLLFFLGRQLYNHRFGMLWVLSYSAAILPFFFFKSAIEDPWFNYFIFAGISSFIFYLDPEKKNKQLRHLLLSAFLLGLAVLTKGPVALLIYLLTLLSFLSIRRFRCRISYGHIALHFLVAVLVALSWFIVQLVRGEPGMFGEYIQYQFKLFIAHNAFRDGFFGYHLVVLLLGVFPASIIALKSITIKAEDSELQRDFKHWMLLLVVVVLVLFSIVNTKLLHYSSLAYFPMTFLAAWVWDKWMDRRMEIGGWQLLLIFLITLVLAFLAIVFPLLTEHHQRLLDMNPGFLGPFGREALTRNVHWSGFEWLVGVFLLIGVIFALVQILRRDRSGLLILHIVILLFVFFSISLFAERVEGYTQRDAVKFYKEHAGEEVYMETLGFRSYAHLFYFDKQVPEKKLSKEALLTGELDRDAYFVIQVDKKEHYLANYPELEVLEEKHGYVFTVRRAIPVIGE